MDPDQNKANSNHDDNKLIPPGAVKSMDEDFMPQRTKRHYMSPRGYQNLRDKLKEAEEELNYANDMIADATDGSGDTWHDNFPFEEGQRLKDIAFEKISDLRSKMGSAIVIDIDSLDHDHIAFGATVDLEEINTNQPDRFSITILGPADTDPDKGIISYESPIAKALIGKGVGDTVKVQVHDHYEIKVIGFNYGNFVEEEK